ncbi:MAG: peptidylprolyl isomerase [Ktedonobacteraceae bacterium]|nr:peptidylprolyl isomerase [Ktedonobacteraceae bacterium]
MPKTTKRAASKRATKIARAHATELPRLEVKEAEPRRLPGYKPPARGIARYPWATAIVLVIIAAGIFALYANHAGPFALPKPAAKPTVNALATATASAQKTATVIATNAAPTATAVTAAMPAAQKTLIAASPCLASGIISKITDAAAAPTTAEFNAIKHTYSAAPTMSIDTKKVYCAGINTDRGLIVVELRPDWAPVTVNNFVYLAQNKFYDGIVFHRVNQSGTLKIIQTGDPQGTGTGGPGYKFKDEPVKYQYYAGTLAMANSGANTNGSQFFVNLDDNSKGLAKSYNLFGIVVKGMDVALQIQGPGDDASTKNIKPDKMRHVIVVPAS